MKKIAKILASSLIGLGLALTATACSQLNCIEVGDKYTGEASPLTFTESFEEVGLKYENLLELNFSDVSAQILKGKDYDSISISYSSLLKTTTKITNPKTSKTTTSEETSEKTIVKGTYPLYKDGDKIYIEMDNVPELVTYLEKTGNTETKTDDVVFCVKNIELTFDKENLSFIIPITWMKLDDSKNRVMDVANATFSLTKQDDKANE